MAIDRKKIVTDITLELDEDEISVNDFTKAVDNFIALVKEVAKSVAPKKDPSAWNVTVYPGSAGIGVRGTSTFTSTEVHAIRSAILDGVGKLETGLRSEFFSDKAIDCARNIASLFKKKDSQPSVNLIGGKDTFQPVTRNTVVKASEILDPAYTEDGAVDGVLEKLSAHGGFNFVVYDPIDDRAIQCEVNESLMDKAWQSWRKRVEVTGKVRYRRDGMAVSVKAVDIFPFPEKSDIPSLDQLRGLLAGG